MWTRQHPFATDAIATILAIAGAIPAFRLAIRYLLSLWGGRLVEPLETGRALVLFVGFPALAAVAVLLAWMVLHTVGEVWPHGPHHGAHP
jgi:hypothetical protein